MLKVSVEEEPSPTTTSYTPNVSKIVDPDGSYVNFPNTGKYEQTCPKHHFSGAKC